MPARWYFVLCSYILYCDFILYLVVVEICCGGRNRCFVLRLISLAFATWLGGFGTKLEPELPLGLSVKPALLGRRRLDSASYGRLVLAPPVGNSRKSSCNGTLVCASEGFGIFLPVSALFPLHGTGRTRRRDVVVCRGYVTESYWKRAVIGNKCGY